MKNRDRENIVAIVLIIAMCITWGLVMANGCAKDVKTHYYQGGVK